MDIIEAMQKRHSVRSYLDKPIAADLREKLQAEIKSCNAEGGLNFQLVTDEERAFGGLMAHYGKFSGVKNYVALVGKKAPTGARRLFRRKAGALCADARPQYLLGGAHI